MKEKKLNGCLVALMICFWPVGVAYLIIKKLNKDKNDYAKTGNVMTAFGAFLIFTAVIYLFAGMTGNVQYNNPFADMTGNVQSDNPDDILYGVVSIIIFCGGGGAALLYSGRKKRKVGKLIQTYIPVVESGEIEELDHIAQIAQVNSQQAEADLRLLMEKGILKDRYIDTQKRLLVWTLKPREEDLPREKIICPHCGGTNLVIYGKTAQCEYCDSTLG